MLKNSVEPKKGKARNITILDLVDLPPRQMPINTKGSSSVAAKKLGHRIHLLYAKNYLPEKIKSKSKKRNTFVCFITGVMLSIHDSVLYSLSKLSNTFKSFKNLLASFLCISIPLSVATILTNQTNSQQKFLLYVFLSALIFMSMGFVVNIINNSFNAGKNTCKNLVLKGSNWLEK